jgi:hypothetical protein
MTTKGSPTRRPAVDKPSPWPKRLIIGGGFVAFVLLTYVIVAGTLEDRVGGIPEGTEQVTVGAPTHVEGPLYTVDQVPAGGEHASIWANCGFYTEWVPAENVVHSLEHGAVWIAYRPDLPESQLDVLRSLSRPGDKVLASPVEGLASPLLATAWGYQLVLADAEDPRLDQFVVEFAGSLGAPEPGGACSGGVGNPS